MVVAEPYLQLEAEVVVEVVEQLLLVVEGVVGEVRLQNHLVVVEEVAWQNQLKMVHLVVQHQHLADQEYSLMVIKMEQWMVLDQHFQKEEKYMIKLMVI